MTIEDGFARRITRLGVLADPVRRALYRFVASQPGVVSRDQAAAGVEVPRHTAKFHLEKLVEEGLLVAEFRRLTGRTGPGAGRPAKVYRRSGQEVSVSIPGRRYDLAGRVLADAVQRALDGVPMEQALGEAARGAAAAAVEHAGGPEAARDERARVTAVLEGHGYEPRDEAHGISLRNCPYGRLSAEHPGVVCRANQEFVGAVVEGLGCATLRAEEAARSHGCCVRLESSRR